MKDTLFQTQIGKQFEFDESVASVFDDMLERSIPFYQEQIQLIAHFASLHLEDSGIVYDLGSSTGNALFALHKLRPKATLIGIDNSKAMCERAMLKANAYGMNAEFVCEDFFHFSFKKSNVVIASWTMQFVRPLMREKMIQKIFDCLQEGGIFLMSEKVLSEDKQMSRTMIECYHQYKMQKGYTQFEINQKREALENVLIPYTLDENIAMLKNSGFASVEVLFKWVNFALFIAKR